METMGGDCHDESSIPKAAPNAVRPGEESTEEEEKRRGFIYDIQSLTVSQCKPLRTGKDLLPSVELVQLGILQQTCTHTGQYPGMKMLSWEN